jgi:oxaloacetate decarboxylase gamma subunit
MSENFQTALELLGIGMVTVFAILFLVVFIGNMIIRFVNRFIGEEDVVSPIKRETLGAIDPQKMAAIVSAVQLVTRGKGRVVKVEKN